MEAETLNNNGSMVMLPKINDFIVPSISNNEINHDLSHVSQILLGLFFFFKTQKPGETNETHFLFIVSGQKVNEGNCLTSGTRTELNFGSFL